jgi:hypothetical protein
MYAGVVRTTLTLDPDVAARLAEVQRERGWTFKEAVNQTLRRGLAGDGRRTEERYRMPVKDLGVRREIDVDRIRDVLGALDDAREL